MNKCPKCQFDLKSKWENKCPDCGSSIVHCPDCDIYSILSWQNQLDSPEVFSVCTNCQKPIYETLHVFKSSIYNQFNFAFKFVNRISVPYPMYFNDGFPFGEIEKDIGDFFNDFLYAQSNDPVNVMMGTDWGTARAYKVKIKIDDDFERCIALSHETGLEVFLIAAGTLVGLETSKFVLKRTLETIEKRINQWWKKRKIDYWRKDDSKDPLVLGIQIRTPEWEINIDGKFTQEEKDKLFNLIQNSIKPKRDIDKFLLPLEDKELANRIKSSTRKIAKRKKQEYGI
jgi:hypothetical protein